MKVVVGDAQKDVSPLKVLLGVSMRAVNNRPSTANRYNR
jgi:hypothetical protein